MAFFLGLTIFSIPYWPQLFSYQQSIDPQHLANNYDPTAATGIFNNQIVSVPVDNSQVLGDITSLPDSVVRRLEVDLTSQHAYAYENDQLIYDFLISSGKYDRTPNGTFTIWSKVRSQRMKGGSRALGTYYDLPNVPYVLFFYNQDVSKSLGYSFHGTYWHNNFGTPMSHGCINMKTSDAAIVYQWATVGTQVTIYGKFPSKLANR